MTAGTTVFGRENARNKVDADGLEPRMTDPSQGSISPAAGPKFPRRTSTN